MALVGLTSSSAYNVLVRVLHLARVCLLLYYDHCCKNRYRIDYPLKFQSFDRFSFVTIVTCRYPYTTLYLCRSLLLNTVYRL